MSVAQCVCAGVYNSHTMASFRSDSPHCFTKITHFLLKVMASEVTALFVNCPTFIAMAYRNYVLAT